MRSEITIGGLLVLAITSTSLAQATPTASQLEQERVRIESERKQMFDPNNSATQPRQGQMPDADAIAQEIRRLEPERELMFDPDNPATKNAPNVFPNVPTPERSGIDIEAIAKRYEQRVQSARQDNLLVFVSFSMPKESLRRLITQANRVGAAVVLRGFKNNSFKETALGMKALGDQNANVMVNPKAFAKYKITTVPAIVLTRSSIVERLDDEGCALPDDYVSVAGDASLSYALNVIAGQSASFQGVAKSYLRQLGGQGQ